MALNVENVINELQSNRELLAKFRKVLNLEDDYAKKSDLKPILEELKTQREEFNQRFDNVYAEMKTQREEFNQRFDNVYAEMKSQREEFNQRFDNVYAEMKSQREELKAQREEFSQRFDDMLQEVREIKIGLNQVNQRMDKSEDYLKAIGGTNLELHSRDYFKAILDAKGIEVKKLLWNEHFDDPKQRLGTGDIQIDLFSEDPLIVVEVTNYVDSLEKISKFIRKIEFIREKYNDDPITAIIAYEVNSQIASEVDDLLNANDIKLIKVGRNDYFD